MLRKLCSNAEVNRAAEKMDFTLACDNMMDVEGSSRPAVFLAKELVSRGNKVTMVSPFMSKEVENQLFAMGITPTNLHARLITQKSDFSISWFETWAREAFLGLNSNYRGEKNSEVINFSQVVSIPSLVWYLQGPPSLALKDMKDELPQSFRMAYSLFGKIIDRADKRLVKHTQRLSSMVIANSKFCSAMYSGFGVESDDIIYPPIDCDVFCPSKSTPSSDYVLTYLGKETKFSIVKALADMGVKIKAFGSKTKYLPKTVVRHPNIEFLGRVTTEELVHLYGNALFTLFPFSHEPFGYIPVESMACGTPVVTYDYQGPSESIIDGFTGWLARTDAELIQKTVTLWKDKYPSEIRVNCRKIALRFNRNVYADKWLRILRPVAI